MMKQRHTGNQPRTASTRMFALIDRDLSAVDGLSFSHFCEDHQCHDNTLRNYMLNLAELGVKFTNEGGIWRYSSADEATFTHRGRQVFTP
jgi:hypothetical protein